MGEIHCSKCGESATEGSLKHPYCKKHFDKFFGGDYDKYFKFLGTVHII